MGDFDPHIVALAPLLRNEDDKRQSRAFRAQICDFVRSLPLRLAFGEYRMSFCSDYRQRPLQWLMLWHVRVLVLGPRGQFGDLAAERA